MTSTLAGYSTTTIDGRTYCIRKLSSLDWRAYYSRTGDPMEPRWTLAARASSERSLLTALGGAR